MWLFNRKIKEVDQKRVFDVPKHVGLLVVEALHLNIKCETRVEYAK